MGSSNIVFNFRKFFEEKTKNNLSNKTIKDFQISLKWLCKKLTYSRNNDNCSDIVQYAFENLLKYGEKFWLSVQVKNKTNDKRIYAYLKRTVRNLIFEENDARYEDLRKIKKHINNELDNLIKQGFLKFSNGKYSLNNNSLKNKDCEIEDIFEFYEINSKTQISAKKVNSLLKKIFNEYLENCEVSNSIISEVFLKFIGYSNLNIISIEKDEEDNNKNKISDIIKKSDRFDYKTENIEMISRSIINSQNFLGDKFEPFAKLFLLKYYGKYTLEEISEIINIPKSSIDNYIKKFIGSLDIDKHFSANEFGKYSNIFFEMLANEINFELED